MLQYQEMSSRRCVFTEPLWEGEGEPEQSPQTSKMLGNAEFKVQSLQAQQCNSNTVDESDSFKDQLQKKLCYNLNSGLLFCSLAKEIRAISLQIL